MKRRSPKAKGSKLSRFLSLSLVAMVFAAGVGTGVYLPSDIKIEALNLKALDIKAPNLKALDFGALNIEALASPFAARLFADEPKPAGPAARAEQEARASVADSGVARSSQTQPSTDREGRAAVPSAPAKVQSPGLQPRVSPALTPAKALAASLQPGSRQPGLQQPGGQELIVLEQSAPMALWALAETRPSRASLALPGTGAAALASLTPGAGEEPLPVVRPPAPPKAAVAPAQPEPAAQDPGVQEPSAQEPVARKSEVRRSPAVQPAEGDETQLAWRRNAATPSALRDWPKIAIVIDDLGNNRTRFRQVAELPGGLTLSFLSYALQIEALAQEARAGGHEVMLHVPMEPQGRKPAVPGLLSADLAPAELDRRIESALSRLPTAAGMNNHMGSRFTEDREKMRRVLSNVRSKGMYFLDSRTTSSSVGLSVARELGVPAVERDVFLDHHIDGEFIRAQLRQLERVAREQGYAVAIGHPHAATIQALREWLPTLIAKRLTVTPLSDIIASQEEAIRLARVGAGGENAPR